MKKTIIFLTCLISLFSFNKKVNTYKFTGKIITNGCAKKHIAAVNVICFKDEQINKAWSDYRFISDENGRFDWTFVTPLYVKEINVKIITQGCEMQEFFIKQKNGKFDLLEQRVKCKL